MPTISTSARPSIIWVIRPPLAWRRLQARRRTVDGVEALAEQGRDPLLQAIDLRLDVGPDIERVDPDQIATQIRTQGPRDQTEAVDKQQPRRWAPEAHPIVPEPRRDGHPPRQDPGTDIETAAHRLPQEVGGETDQAK